MYNDEKSASDFFYQDNQELESAFDSGELRKSNKMFITSSAAGKNMEEIMNLTPYYMFGLEATLFYKGFELNNVDSHRSTFYTSNEVSTNASNELHDTLILETEMKNLTGLDALALSLINLDISIYQIVSYILAVISFAGFIWTCWYQFKNKFRNRNINMLILFNIMLFGTVIVQIIAIVWFCSFLGPTRWIGSLDSLLGHIKFYLVSAYGFYAMFIVLSIYGAYITLKNYEFDKNQFKNIKPINDSTQKEATVPQPQNYKQQQTKTQTQQQNYKQQQTKTQTQQQNYKQQQTKTQDDLDMDSLSSDLVEQILKEIEQGRKNKD